MGERVEAWYARAQSLVSLESVSIEPLRADLTSADFPRPAPRGRRHAQSPCWAGPAGETLMKLSPPRREPEPRRAVPLPRPRERPVPRADTSAIPGANAINAATHIPSNSPRIPNIPITAAAANR